MPRKLAKAEEAGRLEKLRAALHRLAPSGLRAILRHIEKEASDPATVLRLSVRASAFCVIATMLISYPLWFTGDRLYLPTPLVPALLAVPQALNLLFYIFMLGVAAMLFVFPERRKPALLLLPVYMFFVAQDQLRGQFSLYMFLFNLAVAACLPRRTSEESLDPLRFMIIGIYVWAGIYKINTYFFFTMFPWFVDSWFPLESVARVIGFAVPLIESSVGVFLLFPRTRWIGQLMAFAMLLVVLLSIGPTGHNQAMSVWPANIYLDSMAIFLFMEGRRPLWVKDVLRSRPTQLAAALFLLLPMAGAADLIGYHPSFKLYCCGNYAVIEFAKGEDLSFLPGKLGLEVNKNRAVSANAVAVNLYEVSASPLVPGDAPFLQGMRGFCPHLLKPAATRLRIGDLRHFWSADVDERIYDICAAPEPRLLCTNTYNLKPGPPAWWLAPSSCPVVK